MTRSRGQLMLAKILSGPLGRLLLLGVVAVVVMILFDPAAIFADLSAWVGSVWGSISDSIGVSEFLGGILP